MIVVKCIYEEEYYERVFTPPYYVIVDSEDDIELIEGLDYAEASYEVVDTYVDYVEEYMHDFAGGYDLCNGRMSGLAANYTWEQFFDMITSDREYSKKLF